MLKRIGRRGISFFFLGFIALVIAVSATQQPISEQARINATIITAIAPFTFWACVWAAAALSCFTAVAWKRAEFAAAGFVMGAGLAFAGGYFWAWITVPGTRLVFLSSVLYLMIAVMVGCVAGWKENHVSYAEGFTAGVITERRRKS